MPRVEAAQNDLVAQHIFDDRQRARMIDERVKEQIERGQVAHMPGLAQETLLVADSSLLTRPARRAKPPPPPDSAPLPAA